MTQHDSNDVAGYEHRDVPARVPFRVIMFMGLFVPIGLLVVWLLMTLQWPMVEAPSGPFSDSTRRIPEPRLQTDPPRDYAAFRRDIERRLNGIGWVDRQAKVVHLPIEQAKLLLLERGLPEQSESPAHSRVPLEPRAATQWLERAPDNANLERQQTAEPAEKAEVAQ